MAIGGMPHNYAPVTLSVVEGISGTYQGGPPTAWTNQHATLGCMSTPRTNPHPDPVARQSANDAARAAYAAPGSTDGAPLPAPAPATSTGPAVVSSLRDVSKVYGQGETKVAALDHVSVDFYAGHFTAIMGPSGSGKSTMLNVLAGLDNITSGVVSLEGVQLQNLNDDALTRLRRDRIGFVFQSFNLIPTLDAEANITLPSRLAGHTIDSSLRDMIITSLGIQDRLHHLPAQLSGGQQQRVALARALVTAPAIVVADEPTGNLDSASTEEVLNLLRAAVDELNQTIIMVTHDQHVAQMSDRVIVVRDGQVTADLWSPTPEQIEQVA